MESRKKYIVVAGLLRSGSTWLYNAVRLSLIHADISVYASFLDESYDRNNPAPVHLIKVHNYHSELASAKDQLFMSVRDPRDMVTSAIRKKMIRNNDTEVLQFLNDVINVDYHAWSPHINLEFRYELSVSKNQAKTIEQIHQSLALPMEGVEKVIHSLEAIIPTAEYDRTTLLWPDHLNGGKVEGFNEVLNRTTIEKIEKEFSEWMISKGYK